MKESMWGYLIIVLGVVVIAIIFLVQRLTTTNEEDYHISREVMEAAMVDAVDYSALRGDDPRLIMSRDKFAEIFIRRFAESITTDKEYKIDFYQISEEPPAATVRIRTYTGSTNVGTANNSEINIAVDTKITAVLVYRKDGKIEFRTKE